MEGREKGEEQKKSLMLSKNRSDPDIVSSGRVVQGVGFTLGDLVEDRFSVKADAFGEVPPPRDDAPHSSPLHKMSVISGKEAINRRQKTPEFTWEVHSNDPRLAFAPENGIMLGRNGTRFPEPRTRG